jgi:hypothetical protein
MTKRLRDEEMENKEKGSLFRWLHEIMLILLYF